MRSIKPSKEVVSAFKESAKSAGLKIEVPDTVYKGNGCGVCGFSGYHGQIGIFEILYISDAVRELITNQASVDEIRKKAREEGMKIMLEDGLAKIESGQTTLEEVLRVAGE